MTKKVKIIILVTSLLISQAQTKANYISDLLKTSTLEENTNYLFKKGAYLFNKIENYEEILVTSCVISKISDPTIKTILLLLSIPLTYMTTNYIAKNFFEDKNDTKTKKFLKTICKLITNTIGTTIGSTILFQQFKKLNIYESMIQLFGCGTFLEKQICNYNIWPRFKTVFKSALSK